MHRTQHRAFACDCTNINQYPLLVSFLVLFFSACSTTGPTYKVRVNSGDTLVSIAARYGTSWDSVARLNSIKDVRSVKVGDELLVRPGPAGQVVQGTTIDQSFLGEANPEEIKNHKLNNKALSQSSTTNSSHSVVAQLMETDEKVKALNTWPVVGTISSNYGQRGRRFHYGIDIKAPKGTPIHAAAAGQIVFAGRSKRFGQLVIIQHGPSGERTFYAHCSKMLVKEGDQVNPGDTIGLVGQTGNATGVHLHFEYKMASGNAVDPMRYLPMATTAGQVATTVIDEEGELEEIEM